jgi:biopolymer transport protein ExbB
MQISLTENPQAFATHSPRNDRRLAPRLRVAHLIAALALFTWFAPTFAVAASGWWNSDWQFRKAITIRLPPAASGAPSAIVLPIRLHPGNFSYFQDMQPKGGDLRFIADDGASLNYQIELLDPAAGLLVAWVELPLKPGVTEHAVWMYYGNPHATQPDNTAVYDPDQLLVLHFAESQGAPQDATANRYDPAASTAQLGVPGVIGNGARLDGHSVVRIAARPGTAIAAAGGLTFAAWVRLDADSPRAVLYSQAQADRHVETGISGLKPYAEIVDGKRTSRAESTNAIALSRWQHVVVSIGTEIALYLDGAPVGSAPSGGLPGISGDVLIGGLDDSQGVGGFTGQLDEVQISKTPRSAWWAQVTALAQSPESTLVTYGTDESKGSAGKLAAYFAMMRNLLAQVSLDGLVVITITAFLGLASIQVLLSKAALLKLVERQDAKFLDEFPKRLRREFAAAAIETGATEPGAAEDAGYEVSGLHDMYRAGLRGLEAASAASGSSRTAAVRLSTEAFEAIRAALDGALVEASNRMNARLVIMTIAIAGAPFLGLLGTVVGVMITFAAIAAAGDVNVNTIAPGVAAAMTATVVGLLVAIPSLFGYNWLATRISRRTSAMEVFADQFISSVALLALAAHAQSEPATQAASVRPVHAT